MSLAPLLDRQLLVCFGTGGVGKTTIAAALALAAALSGRRAAVLTIDPARALARAFGLTSLAPEPERIGRDVLARAEIPPDVTLDAAMLDQKSAWDAFIRRHAQTPELAERIIDNAFYLQLSTRFAGATEYVAVEEIRHLVESGHYDTIVLDTPAAAHALDFARAPAKIDRMLEPEIVRWLVRSRGDDGIARRIIRRLERATSGETLGAIGDLFSSLEGLLGDIRERAARARRLLSSARSAFVLVTAPGSSVLEQTDALTLAARALSLPIAGVVFNRTHPLPDELCAPDAEREARALLERLPPSRQREWLERTLDQARATDAMERAEIARFSKAQTGALWVAVPELDHDLHSLTDLHVVAKLLVQAAGAAPAADAPARACCGSRASRAR